jgi:hypothetical protein
VLEKRSLGKQLALSNMPRGRESKEARVAQTPLLDLRLVMFNEFSLKEQAMPAEKHKAWRGLGMEGWIARW